MRKKSQDELGTLVTREMKVMLQDESLTKEQRFDILSSVMFDAPLKNTLMSSFANSLKAGFEQINISRYRAIEREREWRKNTERRRRHAGYLDENATTSDPMSPHVTPCHPMSPHDGLKQNKTKQGISPYKPPKGGGRKVPKAVEPEDIMKGQVGAATGHGKGDADFREAAEIVAAAIENTDAFAHMRVNRRNLMRHLLPIFKKNSAAENADKIDYGKAEALGITWDCVDFRRGVIRINKQLQKRPLRDGGVMFTSLKNGKGRVLKPAPYVMELMKKRYEQQIRQKEEASFAWVGWHTDAEHRTALAFTTIFGTPLQPQTTYNHFKKLAVEIGAPNARVHDLRHTYAVLSLQNGDDVKTVQGNLGHATAAFTLDVYGHVSEAMKEASSSRMEQYVRSLTGE